MLSYLVHVHHMLIKLPIIKQFAQQLATYFHDQYMTLISYLNTYHTRKEYILRVNDKSGIFHLGHATDYKQKLEAYQQKL